MSGSIVWDNCEDVWDIAGMRETEVNGIYAEYRAPDPESDSPDKWWWMVKPTGRRSEFPEVYDCGLVDTEESARLAAEASLIKADAAYGTMSPEGW